MTFKEYELYRHTSSLAGKDRTWCAANATKIYNGTALTFSDTGLTGSATYYYGLFAVYEDEAAGLYYSQISDVNETTELEIPPYQDWANYPDSPVLTSLYPYQNIHKRAGKNQWYLAVSANRFYKINTTLTTLNSSLGKTYWSTTLGGAWSFFGNGCSITTDGDILTTVQECNDDIFTDSSLTVVYKAKTTP